VQLSSTRLASHFSQGIQSFRHFVCTSHSVWSIGHVIARGLARIADFSRVEIVRAIGAGDRP
jgi:hypothetical protein